MTEAQLLALFRHTLKVSLSVPLLVGMSAAGGCGGRTEQIAVSDGGDNADASEADSAAADGARPDAQGKDGSLPDAGFCEPVPCGVCPPNCSESDSCVNGVFECGCSCGEPIDAAIPDANVPDAVVDPCNPGPGNCATPLLIPLTCFETVPPGDGGPIPISECNMLCPQGPDFTVSYECSVQASSGGGGDLSCNALCAGGRAYEGMATGSHAWRDLADPLARYFAETAFLEAAAVDAFGILRNELVAHDAPAALVAAAERAAEDEVRHTRITRKLAKRYGARPVTPRAAKRPVRPILDLALENAVEGCVRETFAALVAHHQATAAADPGVRRAMHVIAPDETRHAALGWQVAAWADTHLTSEEREAVRDAQRCAVSDLRASLAADVPASLEREAGVPRADVALRMVDELERRLWA